jgi:uncharacterized cupredoxin-like copper-binding protein
MKRSLVLGLLVLLLGSAGGCGSDDGNKSESSSDTTVTTEASTGPKVDVTLKEFSVAVTPASTPGGEIHFALHNAGKAEHEFVVFKTDLDPAALPLDKDGNVDEEGQGVKHIGEQEDIKPDSTPTLSLSLDPGKYVVLCNLPGHYKAGMHTALTVS